MNNQNVRTASGVVGAALVLLGVLSLVPGITTGLYGELEFAGTGSTAELFGLFQTSWLLLLAYAAIGAVGLAAMRSERGARWFLTSAGVLFLVAWVYGLVTANDGAANFVPFNAAGDWLNLVLGVVSIGSPIALRESAGAPTHRTPHAHA